VLALVVFRWAAVATTHIPVAAFIGQAIFILTIGHGVKELYLTDLLTAHIIVEHTARAIITAVK